MDSARPEPADNPPPGRWRAPREDGQALVDPPIDAALSILRQSSDRPRPSRPALGGLPLDDVRARARRELLAAAVEHTSRYDRLDVVPDPQRPIVLAGHQPALFHPGVWFKNALIGWLARNAGATAINVNIDNDTLKSPSIRAPARSKGAITVEPVFFDAVGDVTPYEERRIVDRQMFDTFGERVARRVKSIVAEPLIDDLWPLAIEEAERRSALGEAVAAARHRFERARGNTTLEVSLSALCRGRAFGMLSAAWFAEARRALEVYNQEILAYRRRYGVRSRNHPAPLLETRGDWIETPFWLWRSDAPARRRLFIRARGAGREMGDSRTWAVEIPADLEAAAARLAQLEAEGWRVRSRALSTTLFLRLLASDLFVHGIGGGLYDRVTDRLAAELFGAEPPPYVVATATLLLPTPAPLADPGLLRRMDAELRELRYHAERFLADPPAGAAEWIAKKRRWIATPQTRDNARERGAAFSEINRALAAYVEERRAAVEEARRAAAAEFSATLPLRGREYSFCLFPEKTWEQLLAMPPLIS